MALFTIAKTWKQPKCPSADEWIEKMCYIYTIEHYSAIKRNEPYHLTCLLRNVYAGQEATVRTGYGTTYWFHIGRDQKYIKI